MGLQERSRQVVFGIGALIVGIVFIVIGTRFRSTIAGSLLIIVGGAISAVGVIFVGMEGLVQSAE